VLHNPVASWWNDCDQPPQTVFLLSAPQCWRLREQRFAPDNGLHGLAAMRNYRVDFAVAFLFIKFVPLRGVVIDLQGFKVGVPIV
jgi:hypothetical protein